MTLKESGADNNSPRDKKWDKNEPDFTIIYPSTGQGGIYDFTNTYSRVTPPYKRANAWLLYDDLPEHDEDFSGRRRRPR